VIERESQAAECLAGRIRDQEPTLDTGIRGNVLVRRLSWLEVEDVVNFGTRAAALLEYHAAA
jgi:hypothetical protein